jgi:hypothetical protein
VSVLNAGHRQDGSAPRAAASAVCARRCLQPTLGPSHALHYKTPRRSTSFAVSHHPHCSFFDDVRGEAAARSLSSKPIGQDLSSRYLALGSLAALLKVGERALQNSRVAERGGDGD